MAIQFTDAFDGKRYIMFGDEDQRYQLRQMKDPWDEGKYHFELNRNENRAFRLARFSLTFDDGTQPKDMFVAALRQAQAEMDASGDRYIARSEDAAKARAGLEHLQRHLASTAAELDAQEAFEKAKVPTAKDVQNLVLINSEYVSSCEQKIHTFTCEVDGKPDILTYTVQRHDEGEGFTIHTQNDNIWERMPPSELRELGDVLEEEAVYQGYRNRMLKISTLEDLKDLEYEIMEDESPGYHAVSGRIWKAYNERWKGLGGELDDGESFTEAIEGMGTVDRSRDL